ncbi:MAG: beta strand repeat-containing protein [Planctomycetaceae bacterium]
MANKWPLANGNYSNATNWNDGTLPAEGDMIYADGKTITVDVDILLGGATTMTTAQRSGGTAGGVFNVTGNRTIHAHVLAGTTAVLAATVTGVNLTLVGDVTGSATTGIHGINFTTNLCTVHVTGNALGGSIANSSGIAVSGGTSLTLIGNATGGAGGNSYGVYSASSPVCIITGNITAGSASGSSGLFSTTGVSLTIQGNIQGVAATGAAISTASTVTITGDITGGNVNSCYGASITSCETVNVTGDISGGTATNSHGLALTTIVSGTVNGTCRGGSNTSSCGLVVQTSGTYTLNGDAYGGLGQSANGAQNSNGTVLTMNGNGYGGVVGSAINSWGVNVLGVATINGNLYGGGSSSGHGSFANSSSSVTVNGDVVGGTSSGAGISLAANSTVTVNGTAIGNEYGNGTVVNQCPGASNSLGGVLYLRAIRSGSYGMAGVQGTFYGIDHADAQHEVRVGPNGAALTLVPADAVGDPPAVTDVREGVAYHYDTLTGTLAVPTPAQVLVDVPTDDTVGTFSSGTNGVGDVQIVATCTPVVSGVKVSIVGTGTYDHTGTSGVARLNVDPDETYTLRITAPTGYEVVGDIEVEVGSINEAVAITLVPTTYPTAPTAGICEINDYILDAGLEPVEGAIVAATASTDAVLVNAGVLSQVVAKAVTDEDGYFQLRLVRADAMTAGKEYSIEIKHQTKSIYRKVTGEIPNAATALLKEIVSA